MTHLVRIDDTAMPDGVIRIADQLPGADVLQPGDTVTLKFTYGFVYLTGLVLLAAWRKSLPGTVLVAIDDTAASPETRRFLTNTGFREVIETGTSHPSVPSRIGKVPIQAILQGREKEATVNEIVRIFDDYAGHVPDTAPFRVLLSELCENALAHSELTTPGYICARVFEDNNRCEIAIADTGIGIDASFRQGTNKKAIDRIAQGESAIAIALEGLSSSKPQPGPGTFKTYFGFGLFITRRLVEVNRGRLTLLSGAEAVTVEKLSQRARRLVRPWRGTFAGVVLDLSNPLPLEQVYAEAHDLMIGPHAPATPKPPAVAIELTATQPEEFALRLSNYGTQLLTRELGTAIRADVAGQLAAGRLVKVRLDGIEDITPSCVDEAFGKLSEVIGAELFGSKVSFEGGQPVVKTLIQFVLRTRQRSA
jgi:hypothetical protein